MSVELFQPWRLKLVCAVEIVIFLILIGRLAQLQWYDYDFYKRRMDAQTRVKVPLYAHRGLILDREGRTLGISVEVDSVIANPAQVTEKARTAKLLAECLHIDYMEVLNKLQKEDSQFCWIKRKVSREEASAVTKLRLPGVSLMPEEKRTYPLGWLASHVIGYVDMDNKGCAGIELLFDKCLAGTPGYQYVDRDGRRKNISGPDLDYQPPQHGYTVVLTIDQIIQRIVEEELDAAVARWNPKGAVAIAILPQTCEILALANRPTYDPNRYTESTLDSQRNRAITDPYEPGSTFKSFVFLTALEQRLIEPDTMFDCHNGVFKVGRRVIHDVHPYGLLTAAQVLINSSNIGMAQIGLMLGRRGLMNCIETFNFGRLTGIELPAEEPGIVQRRWTDYTITSVPMGQEIAVTPLQLAVAYVALANGGTLYQPRIVRGVADSTGTKMLKLFPTSCRIRRVASEEVVKQKLLPILSKVVDEGTGTRAKVPGYTVGGKTGTAQKITRLGPTGKYVSSFVGFAPASDPKIVVLVLMDEPGNGGYYAATVVAPAAGQMISRILKYWRIPPDAPEQRAESGEEKKWGSG